MKNNLKRIAIILPVIALLLAFLAVPAAADGVPGVTSIIEASPIIVLDIVDEANFEYVPGKIFSYNDFQYNFRYRVTIEPVDTMFTVGDVYNGVFLLGPLYNGSSQAAYALCDGLAVLDSGLFNVRVYGDTFYQELFFPIATGATEVFLWFQDWPLDDVASVFYELPIVAVEEVRLSPTEPIGNVWTGIMTWITSALTTVMGAFYVDGSLTLLGTLACIGVSVGIGFLLIGLIQRFLKLRG